MSIALYFFCGYNFAYHASISHKSKFEGMVIIEERLGTNGTLLMIVWDSDGHKLLLV
ncbi:hypothetical protein [Vibrio sp. E150_018]